MKSITDDVNIIYVHSKLVTVVESVQEVETRLANDFFHIMESRKPPLYLL